MQPSGSIAEAPPPLWPGTVGRQLRLLQLLDLVFDRADIGPQHRKILFKPAIDPSEIITKLG